MFEVQTFVVLLFAAGVLTSSVSKTDDSRNETHSDLVKNFHNSESVSPSSTPLTKLQKILIDNTRLPIMGEGGPIYQSTQRINLSHDDQKTAPKATMVAEGIKLTSDELIPPASKSKEPKIRNPSVVARKGAIPPSKISARKGVGLESLVSDGSPAEGIDEALSGIVPHVNEAQKKKVELKIPEILNNTEKSTIESTASPDHIKIAIPVVKKNSSTVLVSQKNSATSQRSTEVTPTIETKVQNAATTTPVSTTRRFKPKPTVTIGEMDIDKPIPASPTKTPPLGMPRKIDYIVPVIITIMALPLLGGAAFFLYKRGRDCWDKRHYRRMDFLIDGMYNDHTSWK